MNQEVTYEVWYALNLEDDDWDLSAQNATEEEAQSTIQYLLSQGVGTAEIHVYERKRVPWKIASKLQIEIGE